MKNIFALSVFAIFILLSACQTVEFEKPVPASAQVIKEFPKDVQGVYLSNDKKDTLYITDKEFHFASLKKQSYPIQGKLDNENTVLKPWKSKYILNGKNPNSNYWTAVPFEKSNDSLYIYYLIINDKDFGNDTTNAREYTEMRIKGLNKITNVSTYRNENTGIKTYHVNPTDEELQQLFDKGYFVKIGAFYELRQ